MTSIEKDKAYEEGYNRFHPESDRAEDTTSTEVNDNELEKMKTSTEENDNELETMKLEIGTLKYK